MRIILQSVVERLLSAAACVVVMREAMMVEGASLTAIRTSAASALATGLLERKDAKRLAVLGNGEHAMRHISAMLAVRSIDVDACTGDAAPVGFIAAQSVGSVGNIVKACPAKVRGSSIS